MNSLALIADYLQALPSWFPLACAVMCVSFLYKVLGKKGARPKNLQDILIDTIQFEDITTDPNIAEDITPHVKQVIRCHLRIMNHSSANISVCNVYFSSPNGLILCDDLWGMKKHAMERVLFSEDTLSLDKLTLIHAGMGKSFSFCILSNTVVAQEDLFTLHMTINHVGLNMSPMTLNTKGNFQKMITMPIQHPLQYGKV